VWGSGHAITCLAYVCKVSARRSSRSSGRVWRCAEAGGWPCVVVRQQARAAEVSQQMEAYERKI